MIFPEDPQTTFISEAGTLDRRRLMGGLGMAGLGLLATSTQVTASPFQKTRAGDPNVRVQTQQRAAVGQQPKQALQLNYSELPSDWVRKQGWLLPEYNRYLSGLKLRTISPQQVIAAHAKIKGTVWNSLPPKEWWTRMGYTLRVADRVAMEMNVREVEVVSAYRSPAYNARCAGARTGSWHQANVALDVKFPERASRVTATARNLRDRGLFKGGVGGYWNFTHIDTRGENVNW